MSLAPGARLGPYEIQSPLGAGGMGEVYKAHDTKLGRDVPLKVLPDHFASDADRLARFKREAQVLASLNHPNIAAIYGLEESDGVPALVLELVEGPTPADRRGARPSRRSNPVIKEGKMTQRVFGLVLVGTLLSVPATGQTPVPDRWQPPQTSDGQPDMQGFWRNGTAFQAAAAFSLEGDHSRWQAEFVVSDLTPLTVPDSPPITTTYIVEPADGKIPYQPWAAAKRNEFIANMMTPTKREHIDPHVRALLDGVPRNNHVPGEIQIVQLPGYVLLLYSSNHAYRIIPLDERPHLGDTIELFMGDSRGHWERNTLVVDVTNQNDRTWLDWLSFHGDGLHVVERWTLVSPDRIDYTATFEDPSMFTRPWTIAYHFNRHKEEGYEIWEDARHEGERDTELILRGGGFKPEGRDR